MRTRAVVLSCVVAGGLAGPAVAQTPPSTPDPHIRESYSTIDRFARLTG